MEVDGSPQQQTPHQNYYVNEWLFHISQDQVACQMKERIFSS